MDNEKKPKRPRIGATLSEAASASPEGEAHYEKMNYSDHQPMEQRSYQSRPYQPRNYGDNPRPAYRSYSNREGGYQQRQAYNANYRPVAQQNHDEGHADGGTVGDSQQTYQPRQQGGYQQRPYQQRRQQGGYQQRPYQQRRQQGGYQQRPYQQRPYQQRPQGDGYQQHSQNEGYQQRMQGDGYQQTEGYQPRQQGGYQQRPYQQRRQQGNGYQPRGQYRNNQRGGYQQKQRKPGMRFTPRPKQIEYVLDDIDMTQPIRLNKFMANSGICSRREADELIVGGKVKVNGNVVTELGTKINRTDVVECDEKVVTPERKCYVLLNKPKDCVTTSEDPQGRKTVLDLVKNACQERIYPVGRLDRNTTGVLLLTNDGDLASKLTHPKFVKKKIYHVWTDKDISPEDMQRIADGIELEDGEIHADAVSYVSDNEFNQAGVEIHSGRNRIVRRIFEHLGYRVKKLDRVYFAGLTKKNLPRGRWRYLTQEEVNFLRMGSFE